MRKQGVYLLLILSMILGLFSGCSSSNETKKDQNEPTTNEDLTTISLSEVELNHTYTTRFEEVNSVTYPAFSFDYSDNWSITKEEVTPSSEWVTLSNERGVTIDFINIHEKNIGGGSTTFYKEVEVSKIADSSFVPGYVQATDYSDLGKFMVAELKTVGTMDVMTDTDFVPVEDGTVSYAVLPESSIGKHTINSLYYMDLAFWYSGNTLLVASAPDGQFTAQEEKEVIAILSSFRDGHAQVAPTDTPSNSSETWDIETIDELWELLSGEWLCKEYQYLGKTYDGYEHVMQLQYIDGQPSMIRQSEDGRWIDAVFDGFTVDDDTHFNAYTYRKGIDDPSDGNWGDEVEAAWYAFDMSNLSDNKLTVYYYISTNDFLDNHKFEYVRN